MKIRNCPPEADPPLAEKLKILLASLVFLSFAFTADAALIIQAPTYIGLNSGLWISMLDKDVHLAIMALLTTPVQGFPFGGVFSF